MKQDCLIDLHVLSDHTILPDKPTDSSGEEGLIFLTAADFSQKQVAHLSLKKSRKLVQPLHAGD